MTEAVSEQQAVGPAHFPWESQTPQFRAYGFKKARGHVAVTLGYAVYPEAVLLYSTLTMPSSGTQGWHWYWTSKLEALNAAEDLAGESEAYLDQFQIPERPSEDLDFDDFLDHLETRLNGRFH